MFMGDGDEFNMHNLDLRQNLRKPLAQATSAPVAI
jgi:hypothetical protein